MMVDVLVMDLGGTSSRALYRRDDGELRKSQGSGGNPHRLGAEAVKEVLVQHLKNLDLCGKGRIGRILIGMAGITSPLSRPTVDAAFAEARVDGDIELISDAELTHIAAFGRKSHSEASSVDVLVIAGTGSIAVSISPTDGALVRAGGLGYDSGDEGSGNWIGGRLKVLALSDPELHAELQSRKGPLSQVPDAELSDSLGSLMDQGYRVESIATEAGKELLKIVESVYNQQLELFRRNLPCRVRCYGSVLKHCAPVRQAFESALYAKYPGISCADVDDVLVEVQKHEFC